MRVLLTGAFGNVGENTLAHLLQEGYDVTCFDLRTPRTEKLRVKLSRLGSFETRWGDIRNARDVNEAVKGVDCIIHLAAIIPPLSERMPDLARDVNVGGTRNLIKAAERLDPPPKFIFTSSIAVHGPRMSRPPPCRVDEPLNPTDNYSHHKVQCELELRESGLPWTILRLGGVLSLTIPRELDPLMFEVPLDQRVELVHAWDVGLACKNAITADTVGKTLFVGGGKSCQLIQREYFSAMLDAIGIGMLPDSAFRTPKDDSDWFYLDWMDTRESQKLLKFQTHTFDDYLEEFKRVLGYKRYLTRLMRPIIRRNLLSKSPYYKKS